MICDLTTRRFRCRTGRNSAQRARLFLTRWSSVGPMNVGTKMRDEILVHQFGSTPIFTRSCPAMRLAMHCHTKGPPAGLHWTAACPDWDSSALRLLRPNWAAIAPAFLPLRRPPLSGSTVKTGHTPTISARCHRATVPLVTQGSPRTRLAPVAAGGGSRTCPKRTRGLRRVTAGRAGFTVPLSVRSSHEWSRPVKIVANLKPVELRDLRW